MNRGPFIFLAALLALAASWLGFVLVPVAQVGAIQQTNMVGVSATYPLPRPGLAREGLDVYRANGCQYCHSQQVRQTGTVCDVYLAEAGTNEPAVVDALLRFLPTVTQAGAKQLLDGLPRFVLSGAARKQADEAMRDLKSAGAKPELWIVPVGPDIARGWGKRRTVAEDFLFDYPVMLGSQRVGPDLANVGLRQPDPNWHLRHLYAPRLEVKGSIMPSYRFLFETRRIDEDRSADALALPAELAPPAGYEVVPTHRAEALVAYLLSLRADAPLFDAPLAPAPSSSSGSGQTNAPAASASSTNAVGISASSTNTAAPSASSTKAPAQ